MRNCLLLIGTPSTGSGNVEDSSASDNPAITAGICSHKASARAAIESCRLLGLEVGAVDMLDVASGPKVFEVNSSPAIAEMEEATGVDLATPIIERAEALVALRKERTVPSPAPERRVKTKAQAKPETPSKSPPRPSARTRSS